jgi:multidrug efflux pump subunit AcrB
VNAAAGQLPKTMPSPPIFRKVNPADVPVLLIALTSQTLQGQLDWRGNRKADCSADSPR